MATAYAHPSHKQAVCGFPTLDRLKSKVHVWFITNASKKAVAFQGLAFWRRRLLFAVKPAFGVAACALAAATGEANAQTATNTVLYLLNKDSTFEQGCFPPCECPVWLGAPVTGTFLLTPTGYDPLYSYYVVTSVNWRVPFNGAEMIVTGSGTYKVGGEVALLQELVLDLQLGGAEVSHFDSGLVPVAAPFPEIKATISTNHQFCFDSVFTMDASPAPTPRPRLGLVGTDRIVLSWPVSAASVFLEESSDLTATNWTTVTNAPTVVGEENQVVLARPPGNRFYRLAP